MVLVKLDNRRPFTAGAKSFLISNLEADQSKDSSVNTSGGVFSSLLQRKHQVQIVGFLFLLILILN